MTSALAETLAGRVVELEYELTKHRHLEGHLEDKIVDLSMQNEILLGRIACFEKRIAIYEERENGSGTSKSGT